MLKHPLYPRLAGLEGHSRATIWILRAVVVSSVAGVAILGAVLGSPMALMQLFPLYLVTESVAKSNRLLRLKESGLLRELCLTEQHPLVTMAAFQEGASDPWRLILCVVAVCAILPFGLGSPLLNALPFLAILIGLAIFTTWRAFNPTSEVVLHRQAVILLFRLGKRQMAIIGIMIGALVLFSLLMNAPSKATIIGFMVLAIMIGIGGAMLAAKDAKARAMSDADFVEWVRQWCLE